MSSECIILWAETNPGTTPYLTCQSADMTLSDSFVRRAQPTSRSSANKEGEPKLSFLNPGAHFPTGNPQSVLRWLLAAVLLLVLPGCSLYDQIVGNIEETPSAAPPILRPAEIIPTPSLPTSRFLAETFESALICQRLPNQKTSTA